MRDIASAPRYLGSEGRLNSHIMFLAMGGRDRLVSDERVKSSKMVSPVRIIPDMIDGNAAKNHASRLVLCRHGVRLIAEG